MKRIASGLIACLLIASGLIYTSETPASATPVGTYIQSTFGGLVTSTWAQASFTSYAGADHLLIAYVSWVGDLTATVDDNLGSHAWTGIRREEWGGIDGVEGHHEIFIMDDYGHFGAHAQSSGFLTLNVHFSGAPDWAEMVMGEYSGQSSLEWTQNRYTDSVSDSTTGFFNGVGFTPKYTSSDLCIMFATSQSQLVDFANTAESVPARQLTDHVGMTDSLSGATDCDAVGHTAATHRSYGPAAATFHSA